MLVSVVIPVYNAEEWISETIGTVLKQTCQDLEVIVVDDGSTDRTARVAEEILFNGKRPYRILGQSNKGVSAARNRGWTAARGRWVQFLDADDLLHPRKIELQTNQCLTCPPVAVAYSDWQRLVWSTGAWNVEETIRTPLIGTDAVADILLDKNFMQLGCQLFSIGILDKVNGFNELNGLVEDVELSLKIAMAGGLFAKVASGGPVSWYRNRPRSLSKSNQDAFVEACIRNAKLVERYFGEQGDNNSRPIDNPKVIDAIVGVYFGSARYFAQRNWKRFEQIVEDIEKLRPGFVPCSPPQLKVLSRVAGYRNAERLAILYGKSKSVGAAVRRYGRAAGRSRAEFDS